MIKYESTYRLILNKTTLQQRYMITIIDDENRPANVSGVIINIHLINKVLS